MKLWNEFIYSLRMLRKTPGVSLLVVFTLALGMGATAAVFSVIYAVLLKPLPYPDSGRIVAFYEIKTAHDEASQSDVSPGNFLDWREQSRSFSAIAGFAGFHYILTGNGAPQHLWGGAVSADWWKVFGVQPEIGRVFTAEEDRPNASQVAVLTDRLWRTLSHADPQIVGSVIRLNGEPYTVLGVMRPDPTILHTEIDFWTPLQRQILPQRMLWRGSRFLRTFARLRPGISLQQAADDLNRISAVIQRDHAVPWKPDLRRRTCRPFDFHCSRRTARWDCSAGELHSGPPRQPGGPHGSSTLRVNSAISGKDDL